MPPIRIAHQRPTIALFALTFTAVCFRPPLQAQSQPRLRSDSTAIALASQPQIDERWRIPPRSAEELRQVAALEQLNRDFRETYRNEQAAVRATLGTVIILRLSGATLFRNGQIVETKRVIPAEYHHLRYCSHAAFTVYMKLARQVDRPLDPEAATALRTYLSLIASARPALASLSLTPVQLARQQQILDRIQTFILDVLAHSTVSRDDLRIFARGISLLVEQNTFDAGAAQVDGLHKQVLEWRKLIPDQEWLGLHVVVSGGQQARSSAVATQYFSVLFQDDGDHRGYPGESRRLVYREDTPGEESPPWDPHLALLATVNLDADAGQALFSDPDRLSLEVMADGAKARLRTLDLAPVRVPFAK